MRIKHSVNCAVMIKTHLLGLYIQFIPSLIAKPSVSSPVSYAFSWQTSSCLTNRALMFDSFE